MSTAGAALRPTPVPSTAALRGDPVAQSLMLLRIAFTVAPILFGLDKFANVLTDDWTKYLATPFNDILPGSAATGMHIVGVVEIAAGLLVLLAPRIGSLVVAGKQSLDNRCVTHGPKFHKANVIRAKRAGDLKCIDDITDRLHSSTVCLRVVSGRLDRLKQ